MLSPLTERFQLGGCAGLPFAPRVRLTLPAPSPATATRPCGRCFAPQARRRGSPAPRSPCPPASCSICAASALSARANSPPKLCPRRSRIGRLRLQTPLSAEPLQGPIYLREPRHRLPDLIAELGGEGLRFTVAGHTAAPRDRLRFVLTGLPDLPIDSAKIDLVGGRRGILVNSQDLCRRPRRARIALAAHSGARHRARPKLHLHGQCKRR